MDIKHALKKLEDTPEFKKWHKNNKKTYFSYAFKILQEMQKDEWQVGFHNPKNDKITTFVVINDTIKMRPEEDVFKREETKINAIEPNKVNTSFDDAVEKAEEFQRKNFPKDKSVKTIAILQNISELGNIWNITYITESFNTLNMKIDASNGKILEHNLASIFSFRQKD